MSQRIPAYHDLSVSLSTRVMIIRVSFSVPFLQARRVLPLDLGPIRESVINTTRNERNRLDRSRFAAYRLVIIVHSRLRGSNRRVDSNSMRKEKKKKKRKQLDWGFTRFTSISCVISRGPTDERTEIAHSIRNLYVCRVPDRSSRLDYRTRSSIFARQIMIADVIKLSIGSQEHRIRRPVNAFVNFQRSGRRFCCIRRCYVYDVFDVLESTKCSNASDVLDALQRIRADQVRPMQMRPHARIC